MPRIFWTERERKEIRDAARAAGVDEDEFTEYLHEVKKSSGRGPPDNFTFADLVGVAKEFRRLRPRKSKPRTSR